MKLNSKATKPGSNVSPESGSEWSISCIDRCRSAPEQNICRRSGASSAERNFRSPSVRPYKLARRNSASCHQHDGTSRGIWGELNGAVNYRRSTTPDARPEPVLERSGRDHRPLEAILDRFILTTRCDGSLPTPRIRLEPVVECRISRYYHAPARLAPDPPINAVMLNPVRQRSRFVSYQTSRLLRSSSTNWRPSSSPSQAECHSSPDAGSELSLR